VQVRAAERALTLETMRFRPEVDVVILTRDDGAALDEAVSSALGSLGIDVRVWVIDNGSQPPARVVDDPRVKLYRNQKDLGVAAGRNQGVRVGKAPFVCLLDSEARLHPNTLLTLAGALEDDPKLGLVGPVFDGQEPEATAGTAPTLLRLVARVRTRAPSPTGDRREVDWLSGACQVFGREGFNYVGGFDEWYFYGPESVDFCLRIREAGLRAEQLTTAHCAFEPRPRRSRAGASRRVRWSHTLVVAARHLVRGPSIGPGAGRRATVGR
jgi:N-acetylglucosaminyl-diphospho-decaprenol L-rhamnosyltransferase